MAMKLFLSMQNLSEAGEGPAEPVLHAHGASFTICIEIPRLNGRFFIKNISFVDRVKRNASMTLNLFNEVIMAKLVLLISCLFSATSAIARSNIVGTWINNGNTLSIQIIDDPATAPFTAGEIWTEMKASGSSKTIKTPNFELKCSGATDVGGKSFGSCKIKVARSLVISQPTQTNFAISKEEGAAALNEFSRPNTQDNILVKSGSIDQSGRDQFMFEANWRYNMIGVVLSNSLISE